MNLEILHYWNRIEEMTIRILERDCKFLGVTDLRMELRGGAYLSRGFDLYSACATGLAACICISRLPWESASYRRMY